MRNPHGGGGGRSGGSQRDLAHDAQGDYVFALNGETVARRPVKKGASSVTAIQVVEGLAEGDAWRCPPTSAETRRPRGRGDVE